MITNLSFTTAVALSAVASLAACASSGETSAVIDDDPSVSVVDVDERSPVWDQAVLDGQAYTMVVLRSGEMALETKEELARLTTAHTEFVEEMTAEGFLLASGPMVPPRVDQSLRGMFLCDSSDVESALAQACADPATEAGVFSMEAVPFVTSDNVRPVQRSDEESVQGRAVARPFVVVAGESSSAMEVVVERLGKTAVLSGQCVGGSLEGVTIVVLDCRSVGEAQNAMSMVAADVDSFEYHPWVTSASLVEVASR